MKDNALGSSVLKVFAVAMTSCKPYMRNTVRMSSTVPLSKTRWTTYRLFRPRSRSDGSASQNRFSEKSSRLISNIPCSMTSPCLWDLKARSPSNCSLFTITYSLRSARGPLRALRTRLRRGFPPKQSFSGASWGMQPNTSLQSCLMTFSSLRCPYFNPSVTRNQAEISG